MHSVLKCGSNRKLGNYTGLKSMVLRNLIGKNARMSSGSSVMPRKFFLRFNDYKVSIHKKVSIPKQKYCAKRYRFVHCAVWYKKQKVGIIDLSIAYSDMTTVFTADTKLVLEHQGKGLASQIYEGLIKQGNLAIQSQNQSKGAMKLWRKLAANPTLSMYFVDDVMSESFFKCEIYNVRLNSKSDLEYENYENKCCNPYQKGGSLLLVSKESELDKTIARYIAIRKEANKLVSNFKKFDAVKI